MNSTYRDIVARSWDVYTTQFSLILRLCILIILPIEVIIAYAIPPEPLLFFGADGTQAQPIIDGTSDIIGIGALVVSFFASIFVTVFTTVVAWKGVNTDSVLHRNSVMQLTQKHFWAVARTIVVMLVLLLLLFIPVIPGFIFAFYWIFSVPAVIISGKKSIGALQASRAVVRGRWREVFFRHCGVGLMLFPFLLMIVIAVDPLLASYPWISAIQNTLFEILATFITVFTTVYYLDLAREK